MTWPNGNGDHWDEPSGDWTPNGGHWDEPSGDWTSDGEGPGSDWEDAAHQRWPLDWHGLYARERWLWFDQLWSDVCMLRDRYHLAVRSGWWEDQVQVETLAALAAWVGRYDSGEWDDPPGKLSLLYDLERVAGLLRDGRDPFAPERDRPAFVAHLIDLGCLPPDG